MIWPSVKIGAVAEILPGFAFKSSDLGDEGVSVIKIGNIEDGGTVTVEGSQCLPLAKMEQRHSKYHLRDRDVIVAMTGATAGKVGRIKCDSDQYFLLNQRVAKFIAKDVDPDFLWHVVGSATYRNRFYSLGGGAAQPNMSGPQIASVEIPLPSHPKQLQIASILNAYDDLIENNRRRIILLEEAARLLYREWFIRFLFPGSEHTSVVNGLPDGWEIKTLHDVAETNPESHKNSKLPEVINYVDIASVSTGRINTKTEMLSSEAPGRARRIARHGDIIWSNVRPNLRAYALVMQPAENDVFSTGFTILRSVYLNPWFLYCFVTSNSFVDHLINHATGTSYPAVRPEDFEKAAIVVPPKALLDEFEEMCRPQFEQIAKLQALSQQAVKARDILLPRLMDGRIEI